MKPLKLLLLIVLAVGGLVYAALMLSRVFTAAPNDGDLSVTRKNVTTAGNGFIPLQTAAAALWWPDDLRDQLNDLAQGTNWEAALASSVLASNAVALAALDAALAAPHFQVPEYQFGNTSDYLSDWKALAHLASVRIYATFKAGEEREAFNYALALIRLANRLQDGGGPVLDYLVGTAVKNIGLTTVRKLTGPTRLSPEELTALALELPRAAGNLAGLTNALKVEYQVQKQYAVDLQDGRITGQGRIPGASLRLLPLYNLQRTQNKFAAHTRKLLQALSQPYLVNHSAITNARPGVARMLLSGNVVGEIIHQMTTPAITGVVRQKSAEHLQVQATATLLALKAYQLKQGRLPTQLNELIPEYLPALPQDDFDGKALRYAPDKKVLYSVSSDGTDDGGVETDPRKHEPDWVFTISF